MYAVVHNVEFKDEQGGTKALPVVVATPIRAPLHFKYVSRGPIFIISGIVHNRAQPFKPIMLLKNTQ